MSKPIRIDQVSPTIWISEYEFQGFWLWDETQKMNLSVKAITRETAFVEALMYYQKRLVHVEKEHAELSAKVEAFLAGFRTDEEPE